MSKRVNHNLTIVTKIIYVKVNFKSNRNNLKALNFINELFMLPSSLVLGCWILQCRKLPQEYDQRNSDPSSFPMPIQMQEVGMAGSCIAQ